MANNKTKKNIKGKTTKVEKEIVVEKKEKIFDFKELIPALVLSFVTCFMLLIFEPTIMYAANMNDFWFDYGMLMKTMFIYFLVAFLGLSFLFGIVYFINKKFFKEKKIFKIFYIASLIIFIATYIQGNYLVGDLPVLTGDEIKWGNYLVNDIITVVIWTSLIVSSVILCKKYKIEEVIKTSVYVVGAIFLMLLTSMLPSLFTENMFASKIVADVTSVNLNTASTDKNFFILMLDTIDSQDFQELLKNDEFKGMLNDFTYYPDTMSAYPYTRDSVPSILSGELDLNEKAFMDYYKEALDNSELFKMLKEKGYDINTFEEEFIMQTKVAEDITNIKKSSGGKKMYWLAKQETKYIAFRYLPYFLKKYTHIESANLSSNYFDLYDDNLYHWNARIYYRQLTTKEMTKTDQKMFKFTHIEGAHSPYDLDEDFNVIEDGNYSLKIVTAAKTIREYLKRLKDSGVYDNSAIIILADHGFNKEDEHSPYGRQNPILFIKGVNEHHDMYTSDKQISFLDLMNAYKDLLDDKKSTELFKDKTNKETRKYIWYKYSEENHMVEYETKGKAWETDKLYKTGKEYNR